MRYEEYELQLSSVKYEKLDPHNSISNGATVTGATSPPSSIGPQQVMPSANCNELTELIPVAQGASSLAHASPRKIKFSEIPKRSKITLAVLAVAYFALGCGFSVPAPFFPKEAQSKNVSTTSVGLVFACYQLGNFISSPIFGQFVTEIGANNMCTVGTCVAGLSSILFGFLNRAPGGTTYVVLAFLLRITEAIGMSAFVTASFAIVSCQFENHVASVFALLETTLGMGMMAGPTVGGGFYELGGFSLPFWVIGLTILINGFVVLMFVPSAKDQAVTESSKANILTLLRSPIACVAMVLVFTGSSALSFLDPTFCLHLGKYNLCPFEISLFFVITPLCHALLAPLWGYLTDKKDIQAPLMLTACITCAVGFLMIGPTPLLPFLPRGIWFITLGTIVFGLQYSCCIIPTMKCLVIGALELGLPENMSTFGLVAGLFNAVFYFGAFVGPTIGGVLMEKIGFEYATTIVAASFLVAFAILSTFFGLRRIVKWRKTVSSDIPASS